MNRRTTYLFNTLLVILCLLLLAYYICTNFRSYQMLENRVLVPDGFVFRNPLRFIFRESGLHGIYLLCDIVFTLLLPVAAIRYWRSKRQRRQTLLLSLLLCFWSGLAWLLDQGFFHLWLYWMDPLPEMTNTSDYLHPAFPALLVAVSFLPLRLFTAGVIDSQPRPTEEKVPLRWMRVSHGRIDSMVTFLFGTHVFTSYFVYGYYNSLWYSNYPYTFAGFMSAACLLVALGVSYLITEYFFRLTPGKVLTGLVVVNASGGHVSFGQVLMRNMARLIPVDRYSFLWGGNWHDSLSRTRMAYWAGGHPLVRQNKLIAGAGIVLGTFCGWLLISTALTLTAHKNFMTTLASTPLLFVLIFLWIFAALLTGWLATVSNFAQNHAHAETKTDGMLFLKIVGCWIPVLNFILPAAVLADVSQNFLTSTHNAEVEETFYRINRFFSRAFAAFTTLLYLGLMTLGAANHQNGMALAALLLALSGIVATLAVVRYTRGLSTVLQAQP